MRLRLAVITLICGFTALTVQATTLSASLKAVRIAEHVQGQSTMEPDTVIVIDIDDSWEDADSLAAAETLRDTLRTAVDDTLTNAATDDEPFWLASDTLWTIADSSDVKLKAAEILPLSSPIKPKFIPNPQRALWLALLLPGAGQIYNRKYWKLPIFYGGFLGCVYAFTWNQQMYLDYSQAYLDIMDDDPGTKSYEAMLPYNYDIAGNTSRLQTLFKKKKDYYRRYRDLSAFCFVGVYLLSVIDAYVDAQLSEFSISDDLSLRVSPAVINNETYINTHSYGLGCSLNF